jgi:MFS family permease
MQATTSGKPHNAVPFYALLTANAISLTGNVFANIAIPWFVLQTTGSPTQTGITGFFTILPVVLAGFLGGTIIDRLGYKRTSIIADLASGLTTALIPLLHYYSGPGILAIDGPGFSRRITRYTRCDGTRCTST